MLAHLVVGLSASLRSMAGAMVRHRGVFDSANADMAKAPWPRRDHPADLLDDFAAAEPGTAGTGPLLPARLFLGDHVTHELDMVFALGLEPEFRADALIAVLNTQVAVPNPFVPAFRNIAGPTADGDRHRMETRHERARGRGSRRRPGVRARQPAQARCRVCAATVSRCSASRLSRRTRTAG